MAKNTGKPKRGGSPKATSSPAIRREVIFWGMAVAGILLLVAVLIPDRVGFVGPFVHNLLIGLFGFGGIVLPIGLVCFAVLGLIAHDVQVPWVRSVIIAWLVLALLHTVMPQVGKDYTGTQYLGAVYNSGRVFSGGVMGAILGSLFRLALGRVLSALVIIVLIIVLVMFVTGISFASLIGRGVDKAKDMYDERTARQYDDDDDFDEEDDDYELEPILPKRVVKKPANRNKPMGLKPLTRRKDEDQNTRAELIYMEDGEMTEEEYKVLLVQEELDGIDTPQEQKPKVVPDYLLPPGKRPIAKVTPRILNFAEEPDPTDEPPADDILQEYEPKAYVHTEPAHEAEPVYAEEYPEDGDDYYEDDTPLVVKGLVDNAAPSAPQTFEYEDDELKYDEYAHLSRLAGGEPTPAPSVPVEDKELPEAELYADFKLPTIDFLAVNNKTATSAETRMKVMENSTKLEETLRSFRIEAKVVEVSVGPTVTRYDISPGPGVKVSSIANLSNDLALSLAAQGIRIEAPIPGKAAVGIEIPNKEAQGVFLREIIENERFENFPSKLAFAVGKDIAGNPVVADVADMPHLLIAGATGAGKSVCINTLIASLLYKAKPDEVKLLMIDPKVVELSVYNGIPHLLIPVVTDPKKASGALNWAVQEMESRYNAFAETGCRDLKGYNRHLSEQDGQTLPQIVIIIDELADLMMTCKGEVEEAICRLAQKARAAGLHLIVATQRPSVDVITGLIKANIPSRLAFAVSSGTDSRTVLDMHGAEKLLGRGDMLFLPRGQAKPIRVQGCFISDKEVEQLVSFLKAQAPVTHTTEMIQQITMPGKANIEGEIDEFFHDAVDFLLVKGKASTSMLQRQFRIGYNRASRLMDDLEMRGIVGPEDGVKPRKVTITREEYREIYGER